MVLMNPFLTGLVLLLACTSPCTSELQGKQSPTQETTTISVKSSTIESQNVPNTTQKLSIITSKPKTEETNNKTVEQRKSRGSTKYSDYVYTTTETVKQKSIIPKPNINESKNTRQTTIRNDRSLNINTDKYNSPEFHGENNIYAETQVADKKQVNLNKFTTRKPWEEISFNEFSIELTTPRNNLFDSKYKKMQEDISRSFESDITTPRNDLFDNIHKQMQEDVSKSVVVELTTPRNDAFDKKFKEMHEDMSKSLDASVDKFFNGKKNREEVESTEKPLLSNSKLDYSRYRSLEAIETINKNKIRKDYNNESGMRMKLTNNFNNSHIVDAPSIVKANQKDVEASKKIDLDEGETKVENINIQKPEKDAFINNKIENDLLNMATTGQEEKSSEHRIIFLSKRGSTIQDKEQTIEKSLSTESGIPIDLYPFKASSRNLDHKSFLPSVIENSTIINKNAKKEKIFGKALKKEDEISSSDIDNKILAFLPLTTSLSDSNKIEATTAASISHTTTQNESVKSTTEIFYNADATSTITDVSASTPFTEFYTTETSDTTDENLETTENFSDTTFERYTSEYYDATDITSVTTSTANTDDTTVYTEVTTENIKMNFTEIKVDEQKQHTENNIGESTSEEIVSKNIRNVEKEEYTTTRLTTVSIVSENTDLENSIFKSNQTKGAENITEHLSGDVIHVKVTTNNIANENFSTTEKSAVNNTIEINIDNDEAIESNKTVITKKNESVSNSLNEITKPPNRTSILSTTNEIPSTKPINTEWESATENVIHGEASSKENITKQVTENDQTRQNEINVNGDKITDECDNQEEGDDYGENNCKSHIVEDGIDQDVEIEDNNGQGQNFGIQDDKKLTTTTVSLTSTVTTILTSLATSTTTEKQINITNTSEFVRVTQENRQAEDANEDSETTTNDNIVGSDEDDEDSGNGGKIAAIVISTIGGICLLLLVALLIIMKKRQKRFNYGQRCRPVTLDAYSMDNVSIHNSTRRKGVLMMSKRSYGNPAFEDPTAPTHLLNFSELLKFASNSEGIKIEFDKIPQVTTKTNELPEGCDVKNRYANVIPLPETRVFLNPVEGVPSSDYINANYVTGPQGARHHYIACQAPMQNTIEDFWRMIWEQQSKVILMLTHLYENGVEKCIDYLPPSEVLDCHRLFGDYQITLKKREVKDKYIISSLQLKNMVSNSWREVTHLWYMGWPEKGVPDETNSLIAFLIEARSCIKTGDNKIKETDNTNISNGLTPNLNPVIVHCSPGTGRTGTVIACDIAIREFELTRKVDIPRIVYRIRRDRASAVQTKEQYAFIYKAINLYATKLTGGVFDSF